MSNDAKFPPAAPEESLFGYFIRAKGAAGYHDSGHASHLLIAVLGDRMIGSLNLIASSLERIAEQLEGQSIEQSAALERDRDRQHEHELAKIELAKIELAAKTQGG